MCSAAVNIRNNRMKNEKIVREELRLGKVEAFLALLVKKLCKTTILFCVFG